MGECELLTTLNRRLSRMSVVVRNTDPATSYDPDPFNVVEAAVVLATQIFVESALHDGVDDATLIATDTATDSAADDAAALLWSEYGRE